MHKDLVEKGTGWVGYRGGVFEIKIYKINNFLCFISCRRRQRYSVHNIIQLIVSMSKTSKILKIHVFKFLYKCQRHRRYLKSMYTDYSVNLTILHLNQIKYIHWSCHCSYSLLYQQPGVI